MSTESNNSWKTNIIVALIALMGTLGAALIANWDKLFSGPVSPPLSPPVSNISQEINNAIKDLGVTNKLKTRLAAIRTLQIIGTETSKLEIKRMIMNDLQTYIKNNIKYRKSLGEGIQEDRGTFRADDIIAAIEALQMIRSSSGARLDVVLTNIDFNRVNLTHLDLKGFDFSYSTFQYAFLSGSDMKNANFNFSDLSYAAIWNADMSEATFHNTKLHKTKFANVQLNGSNIEEAADKSVALFGVKGLTNEQINRFPRYDQ